MTVTEIVRKSITVDVGVEKAFRVFTEGINSWWIRGHHLGDSELKEVVIEPRADGRWYEIDVDGSECSWGRVLVWDPPHRLVLGWQIDATWHFNPDLLTEVDVRFHATGPDRTTVELEHRDLDRLGDDSDAMRRDFDSPEGWQGLLEAFAGKAT